MPLPLASINPAGPLKEIQLFILSVGILFGLSTIVTRKPGRTKLRELAAFQRISSMINRSMELGTIIGFALDEIMGLLGLEAAAFRLVDSPDSTTPSIVYRGFSKRTISILQGSQDATPSLRRQLAPKDPLIVEDVSKWNDNDALAEALRHEGMNFFALYPVCSGSDILGTLGIACRERKPMQRLREDIIQALVEILGIAVVNVRMRGQAKKLSEDLVAVEEVNKIISQGFDSEDIIRRIVIEGKRLVKTSQCHLFLLDERLRKLIGVASTQTVNLDIHEAEIPLTEPSVAITALTERRLIVVEDSPSEERSRTSLMPVPNWCAAIFAPLLTKQQAIGVLVCSDDSEKRRFTQEEIQRAEALAHQAAIALENARLFQVVSRSQKEWETTFDAMQDCVSVHDTTGKVIRANVALARRLKTIPARVVGKYCSELYNPGGDRLVSLRSHTRLTDGTCGDPGSRTSPDAWNVSNLCKSLV